DLGDLVRLRRQAAREPRPERAQRRLRGLHGGLAQGLVLALEALEAELELLHPSGEVGVLLLDVAAARLPARGGRRGLPARADLRLGVALGELALELPPLRHGVHGDDARADAADRGRGGEDLD